MNTPNLAAHLIHFEALDARLDELMVTSGREAKRALAAGRTALAEEALAWVVAFREAKFLPQLFDRTPVTEQGERGRARLMELFADEIETCEQQESTDALVDERPQPDPQVEELGLTDAARRIRVELKHAHLTDRKIQVRSRRASQCQSITVAVEGEAHEAHILDPIGAGHIVMPWAEDLASHIYAIVAKHWRSDGIGRFADVSVCGVAR